MKIQWLGHSAFKLIDNKGTSIITDPFDPKSVGYGMAYLSCDYITSSHGHSDHNYFNGVKGSPAIINQLGSFEADGIRISSVMTSHDDDNGKKRGKNIIYTFCIDGITVCHMGDIGEECSPELVKRLVPVNVLLIPVGGYYTIDAKQAKTYVDNVMPDIVIPMHYKTDRTRYDIAKLNCFLSLFDSGSVIEQTTDTLDLSDYAFNGKTKVIVPKLFTAI